LEILLTGAAGFLGRWVYKKLKEERFMVRTTDIKSHCDFSADITNFNKVTTLIKDLKPDLIIHLAALAGASGRGGGYESFKDPYEYTRVNTLGTLNVCEASRLYNVRKIIHMSSFSIYGVTNEAINEETPLNPNNPYGYSKTCAELIVKNYATNYNVKSIIFRAPLICGENQEELNALREFVSCILDGNDIEIYGLGTHVREWLHPLDVADAYVKAIKYFDTMKDPYEIFVLGSKPISMAELAKRIIKRIGKGEIVYVEKKKQVFDQYTDHSKAQRKLKWSPKIEIDEIIERVIKDLEHAR